MDIENTAIHERMEVVGSDGEKIGQVKEVWADPRTSDPEVVDRYDYRTTDVMRNGTASAYQTAEGTAAPDITVETVDRRYFRVDQGGILGGGAQERYIPFSAVNDVAPDKTITVSCSKDRCSELYSVKPTFLKAESTPLEEDVLPPPV